MTQDEATGSGTSTGTMSLVSSPSQSGAAMEFGISFEYSAGERYWAIFGADSSATNFTYDAQVYIASPSSDIANLEFDMNQVMANGQTVIFAVQWRRVQQHLGSPPMRAHLQIPLTSGCTQPRPAIRRNGPQTPGTTCTTRATATGT